MRKSPFFLSFALAFALAPIGAAALEPPDIMRANFGVLVESHLNPDFESNVSSPSINFDFGAGLRFPFAPESRFSFAPSAHFYSYYGEFNSGQPVSADQAFSSTYILGLMLNAPVMYTMPIGSSKFTFSGGLGLCFDLRVALSSGDLDTSAAANSNKYFWGKGRFIDPSTTIDVDYDLSDRIGVGVMSRILWPIYNLWSGEGYGFFDQAKYIINISVRYTLKPKDAEAPAESAAEPAPATPAAPDAAAAPPAEAKKESPAAP